MIQKGHRHIGLIGTADNTFPSIRERREGYLKALARNGIQETYIENGMLNREAAFAATRVLMQRHPHITAIFAVNDNAAYGSISALRDMGYAVPDQVSVAGFDDLFYAIEMNPPLTTMSIDKVRMGEVAVKQLQYRLQHRDAPVMTQMLDARLIVRQSVKALA
jgi:DNA-binding LacI/PurR family transcriptional regulator